MARKILIRIVIFSLFLVVSAFLIFAYQIRQLPSITSLKEYRPLLVTEVFSRHGVKIGEFYEQKRQILPADKIPEKVIQAFISAEDSHFFRHKGIDPQGILRAFIKNLKAGKIVQGGSTITQQVAKSLLRTSERKFSRKIKEMFLSMDLEKKLTKEEILFLYLNQIYLGHGAYGIRVAAREYFRKNVDELTLAEIAILAGLPQAPSSYSPYANPRLARERQLYVLRRMVEEKYISRQQAGEAEASRVVIYPREEMNFKFALYFLEHLRKYLISRYGVEKVMQGGLKIYTTIDERLQVEANEAVSEGLFELDKRQGYHGPLKKLSEFELQEFLSSKEDSPLIPSEAGSFVVVRPFSGAEDSPLLGQSYEVVVTEVSDEKAGLAVARRGWRGWLSLNRMEWARIPDSATAADENRLRDPSERFEKGDLILVRVIQAMAGTTPPVYEVALEQQPQAQGALLAIEIPSGRLQAMVGGTEFEETPFNRATQALRQVGSTFKPVVYAAALDKGYLPNTIVIDSPLVYGEDFLDEKWKPRNYGMKHYGDTTLRNALVYSRNVVTVKIAQDIGIPFILDYAKNLGIQSPLSSDLSVALGSSSMTLWDLCRVFSIFANQGKRADSQFIARVMDSDGNILEETIETPQEQVISPQTSFMITHMLKGVVTHGTGRRAQKIDWPIAGKTGTTDDFTDAWFVGYSPDILVGVWSGFDEPKSLGKYETGGRVAVPIWANYMKQALRGMPKRDFVVPEGIVFVPIDSQTGELATVQTRNVIDEAFPEGKEPSVAAQF